MRITKKRRWSISWRRCARNAGILLGIELIGTLLLGAGPVTLVVAALHNVSQSARIGVADAFVRPKDPGPVPDAKVVAAANGFGLRLFTEMAAGNEGANVFISPASIATGMAMTYNGAAGNTRASMAKALGLNGVPLDDVNQAYARIQSHLGSTSSRIQVTNAHGVWVDDQARLVPDFARRMEDSFGARAEALDLQAPGAEDQINGWIKSKTKGRIDHVVDVLGPLDRIVLADALTFHGKWTHQFKKSKTRAAPFHRQDGTETTVPMMSQKMTVGVLSSPVQAVRLPYDDGSMAMYIFLPDRNDSLPGFLKTLTSERWAEWMGQFHEREIVVELPRFRAECSGNLNDPLIASGLGEAFDRGRADFSAMARADMRLSIGAVLHKAQLEVDESGTRAEAVTVVIPIACSRMSGIRADRPFFCAIRDERTGLILFAGAIYDPEPL